MLGTSNTSKPRWPAELENEAAERRKKSEEFLFGIHYELVDWYIFIQVHTTISSSDTDGLLNTKTVLYKYLVLIL